MKKVGVLILAGILCLSLFGCGKSEMEKNQEEFAGAANDVWKEMQNQNKKREEIKEENEKIFTKKQKSIDNAVLEVTGDRNPATMVLKSYVIVSDTYNPEDKILVLTMDYTNKYDDYDFHSGVFMNNHTALYQDGVALSQSGITGFEKDQYTSIRSGATIEVIYSYKLRNETSDVEFEVDKEPAYTLKIK